jgi:hypothetical protein
MEVVERICEAVRSQLVEEQGSLLCDFSICTGTTGGPPPSLPELA